MKTWIILILLQNTECFISAASIDHPILDIGIILREDAFDSFSNELPLVIGRRNDTDQRRMRLHNHRQIRYLRLKKLLCFRKIILISLDNVYLRLLTEEWSKSTWCPKDCN